MARNNCAVKFFIFECFIGCSPVFLDNFPREVANDLLALMVPVAAIVATATFLAITYISRYISLGSVVGVVIGAVSILTLSLADMNADIYMVYGLIAGTIIIWQHRDNIQRIRKGTERRLGQPASKVE